MALLLDCRPCVVSWSQEHILDAVLQKYFFRAAALELVFVAMMDVGKCRMPSPEMSSTCLKTGLKYSLFPLHVKAFSLVG